MNPLKNTFSSAAWSCVVASKKSQSSHCSASDAASEARADPRVRGRDSQESVESRSSKHSESRLDESRDSQSSHCSSIDATQIDAASGTRASIVGSSMLVGSTGDSDADCDVSV